MYHEHACWLLILSLKIYLLMVENICGKLKMFNLHFYLQ